MTNHYTVELPFLGFHSESVHGMNLTSALEFAMSDPDGEPNANLMTRAFESVDWNKVHQDYCVQFIVPHWSELTGIPATFSRLCHASDNGFGEDFLYVDISSTDHDRLDSALADLPDTWERDSFCYGDLDSNGELDSMISKHGNATFRRCGKIASYLRERAEREPVHVVLLPFSGFDNTLNDAVCDEAVQEPFTDDSGMLNSTLYWDHAFQGIDWQAIRMVYAKQYVDLWSRKAGVPLTFESMDSPKDRTYSTERIFIKIRHSHLKSLRERIKRSDWESTCKGMFTSVAGFASYYSPDPATWGPSDEWDHNQYGSILQAFQDHVLDEDRDWSCTVYYDLADDHQLINHIQHALSKPYHRAVDVADYLRQRRERVEERESENA